MINLAIDLDVVTGRVYSRAMSYLHAKGLPLGVDATKGELRAAIKVIVTHANSIDLESILDKGPIKDAMNLIYVQKLYAVAFEELAIESAAELAVIEEEVKTQMENPSA